MKLSKPKKSYQLAASRSFANTVPNKMVVDKARIYDDVWHLNMGGEYDFNLSFKKNNLFEMDKIMGLKL